MNVKILASAILSLFYYPVYSQGHATLKEYDKIFPTYPYSDPNPIPSFTKIYPYFRYDGFTSTAINKSWKVVELENDYIQVMILPEIGGKIWAAVEKSTGNPFIYYNHVVKFRDVAMRGPWTSGGLEPNYGIIGHTPNCATPVDYITKKNDDGSVSCIVGVLDLLTRTKWSMEINLPKDKAYFTTASFWHNSTNQDQPYYHWMNTGIKANGNLEFIYPGTHYIGHEGEYSDWPINKSNNKNISFYEENNFGGYKSYHVFGKYTNFFGGYWHDDKFGMARVADYADKAGKKIWIWGLSRQGMIWDKLLTDEDGQYVEVQSGRLFNQNAERSTYTPFKHIGFAPYATDKWKEYWYPVKDTKGFVVASEYGALNIKQENGWFKIFLSPVQEIYDKLIITADNKEIYNTNIHRKPLSLFVDSFKIITPLQNIKIVLGDNKIIFGSDTSTNVLNRPKDAPADFDWNSAYGLYLQGKEYLDQKLYVEAEEKLIASSSKDKNFLPALVKLAALNYRNFRFVEALKYALKALSIDTHQGEANYYYGLINKEMGKTIDAKDGFSISALSFEYRSAAFYELSKIYFQEKDFNKAIDFAQKSIDFNKYNVSAYELLAIIYRIQSKKNEALDIMRTIRSLDVLSHFANVEEYLWNKSEETKNKLISNIKNEQPVQTYLELVARYYQLGLIDESVKIAALSPSHTLVDYWQAYLAFKKGNDYTTQLNKANTSSPAFIFPFRAEEYEVLAWALKNSTNWQPKYYQAILLKDKNRTTESLALMNAAKNESDFAPFYIARAELNKLVHQKAEVENDLQKAIVLDKNEWRYIKLYTEHLLGIAQQTKALQSIEPFYKAHPENYIIGSLYVKTLLANKKYQDANEVLKNIHIIPFEGATEGRELYLETKLMLATQEMKINNYSKAMQYISDARAWPENIGVGKPYDEEIDDRLENWIEYICASKQGNKQTATNLLNKIVAFSPKIDNTVSNFYPANHLVTAFAMEKLKGRSVAQNWINTLYKKHSNNKKIKWALHVFNNTVHASNNTDQDGIMRILTEIKSIPK